MKKVSVRPDSDSGIRHECFDLDGFVNIDNVLALMTELDIKKGIPWQGLSFCPWLWRLLRRKSRLLGGREVIIWDGRLSKIKGTIGVEFKSLGFETFDVLDFLVDFGLAFLDLGEVELFKVGGLHFLFEF